MAVIIPADLPQFTYTGQYETQLRSDWGWVIRFISGGVLKFSEDQQIDVHLLGGGGQGGGGNAQCGGGGGGGYQTIKYGVDVKAGTSYTIVVGEGGRDKSGSGEDGEASMAFGLSAAGGKGGSYGDSKSSSIKGGAGGTGNGAGSSGIGGSNSVREFNGDTSWPIYGGGGGSDWNGEGGYPYGGRKEGSATGYGGGGAGLAAIGVHGSKGGAGGNGIVSIRNSEILELPVKFDGVSLLKMYFNGQEVKHLIHNGTKLFMERVRGCMDCSQPEMRLPQPAR